jgi:hypothetical protein
MSNPVEKDRLVAMRIKMRDTKTEMKKAFEAEYDAVTVAEKTVDAELKRICQEEGITGFKTEYGTVSLVETMKTGCADWSAFGDFLKTQDPLNWLTNSIKQAPVKEYMEAHEGELPPGVSVFRETEARIRRAGEK